MKKTRLRRLAILVSTGSALFQGCPVDGLLNSLLSDCFGENTISAADFDDLNAFEQLLYEENECGRYEERSF